MERLANLNSLSKTLPSPVPTLPIRQATRKRSTVNEHLGLTSDNLQEQRLALQASRRTALGFASVALIGSFGNRFALAEDNGYWLTGPIPVPPIYNKIANEKTGTRSFVRNGIYIADIKVKGSMYRLRKYAFDLLALGDLIGKDALNYVRKYLRLKGTFMYYDFDKVISAASASDKQPLTDLANRLFDKFEKLEDAVKKEDLPETQSCYQDTSIILQEVMDRMA
ncbi:photosynthetic NDH subunit of lumenal location 3, chloroplastic [Rhodamnia argentea]|uniref:Photosynthetic NDH subunit of lumenal location 3, chloroplastic n=1 Tax=Rhodamnia argentea TaxID=178133 RepID=A0A8B8Q963_9MYRT|nr:photosynthetic NDH subunit of lumenal location 3, chloroplastic [Rhodamnia argentea]